MLVTNDDGVDSALLVPLLDALARALPDDADVRCVVPADEQSWRSKAMSRFDAVRRADAVRGEHAVATLSGTPADCAAFGVHHAFAGGAPPDLVVSGPNLGMNAGAAFVQSSGTVGAAVEGAIAGVPSIAFSLSLGKAARQALKETGRIPCDDVACERSAVAVREALAAVRAGEWPAGLDVINVNMPYDMERGCPWEVTRIARSRYSKVFQPSPCGTADTFVHAPEAVEWVDSGPGTDRHALLAGHVSVTAMRLEGGAEPLDATLPWVQRAFGGAAHVPDERLSAAPA